MALVHQANAALNEDFIRRIESAVVTTAVNVAAETNKPSNLQWTSKRSALATRALNDPYAAARAFAWACATNATIAATIGTTNNHAGVPDSDIQFTVNSTWDAVAGVSPADRV